MKMKYKKTKNKKGLNSLAFKLTLKLSLDTQSVTID